MNTQLQALFGNITAGPPQEVGIMIMIPLIREGTPLTGYTALDNLRVSNSGYGHIAVHNPVDDLLIVPRDATFMTKHKSQDHSVPSPVLLSGHAKFDYRTAACVQERTGGMITRNDDVELTILPAQLRVAAFQQRDQKSYSKLWDGIKEMIKVASRVTGKTVSESGHLEYFRDAFSDELDAFCAEFEPVPDQIGAIILINGSLIGFEIVPTNAYWLSIWRPLIRDGYGSMAIIAAASISNPDRGSRLPNATSISEIADGLEAFKVAYKELSAMALNAVLVTTVGLEPTENSAIEVTGPMIGHVIKNDDEYVYASLSRTPIG